jgi:hypothetical protein
MFYERNHVHFLGRYCSLGVRIFESSAGRSKSHEIVPLNAWRHQLSAMQNHTRSRNRDEKYVPRTEICTYRKDKNFHLFYHIADIRKIIEKHNPKLFLQNNPDLVKRVFWFIFLQCTFS